MKEIDLFEGKSVPCIVVDVQPSYTGHLSLGQGPNPNYGWNESLMEFLNNQKSSILMFVNAEQDNLTSDTVDTIKEFWEDNGFDPENWNRVTVNDKGYGYLRGWMDSGVDHGFIIKTIREMYQYRHNDSRDMMQTGEYSAQYRELVNQYLLENSYLEDVILEEPLSIYWTSIAQLKNFSGSYLMGGGREECLLEVQLLMNAFNIRYKLIDKFIY